MKTKSPQHVKAGKLSGLVRRVRKMRSFANRGYERAWLDRIVGKCVCGAPIKRGERDAGGVCSDCWFAIDEFIDTQLRDSKLEASDG